MPVIILTFENSTLERKHGIFEEVESLGVHILAAGQGLEPRYHPPEGRVLPLDEPALLWISESILPYL